MDSKGSPTTPIQASSYFPSDPTNPIPANHSSLAKVEGLKTLVHKRVATFSHLHRVLEGKSHYFNTVLITKEELSTIYDNNKMKKRSLQYFTLGTSLGPIIDIQNPIDFIKSLVSLLQEYEGFSSNDGMKQKRRPFFRKSRTLEDSINTSNNSTDSNDFTNLDIRNIPFELDYLQVFYALCNIICIIYDKIQLHLLNNNCPQVYLDCVFKIDSKFKKIVNLVTKELDLIVHQSIKEELGVIDPLMSQKSGGQFDDWETSSVVSP